MPMPAVLGTIAQQGQAGGGAPTGVSIATSSAGNYDNAILVECASGPAVIDANDGSQFSSNAGDISLNYDVNYNNAVIANSGELKFIMKGYIRATGATSFQWDIDDSSVNVLADSGGAIANVGTSGTASTSQDETGISDDIGESISLIHNSGGRGYLLLSQSGDGIAFDIEAAATNSTGTTDAADVTVTITVD
tara:strand:- start:6249 stop:6827 length:579 start_codon:yes stop_codon:yes gene_type:complete